MNYFEQIYDPVEREFWEGTANKQLLIRYCELCDKPHWYPRPICPYCGHQKTFFKQSKGVGTIYSLTRLHSKGEAPQSIAYIELDDGVTILSKIVEDDEGVAAIGQRVEVTFFLDSRGLHLPVFKPVKD